MIARQLAIYSIRAGLCAAGVLSTAVILGLAVHLFRQLSGI